jgi:hypothetical protein
MCWSGGGRERERLLPRGGAAALCASSPLSPSFPRLCGRRAPHTGLPQALPPPRSLTRSPIRHSSRARGRLGHATEGGERRARESETEREQATTAVLRARGPSSGGETDLAPAVGRDPVGDERGLRHRCCPLRGWVFLRGEKEGGERDRGRAVPFERGTLLLLLSLSLFPWSPRRPSLVSEAETLQLPSLSELKRTTRNLSLTRKPRPPPTRLGVPLFSRPSHTHTHARARRAQSDPVRDSHRHDAPPDGRFCAFFTQRRIERAEWRPGSSARAQERGARVMEGPPLPRAAAPLSSLARRSPLARAVRPRPGAPMDDGSRSPSITWIGRASSARARAGAGLKARRSIGALLPLSVVLPLSPSLSVRRARLLPPPFPHTNTHPIPTPQTPPSTPSGRRGVVGVVVAPRRRRLPRRGRDCSSRRAPAPAQPVAADWRAPRQQAQGPRLRRPPGRHLRLRHARPEVARRFGHPPWL